jgi:hypothetical protein
MAEEKLNADIIWAMFKETDKRLEKMAEEREAEREAERKQREVERKQREAERKQREAEREAEQKKSEAERKERDERLDKIFAKSDKKIAEVSVQLGGIGNNIGEFAEAYFTSALEEEKRFAGTNYDEMETKVKAKLVTPKGKLTDEFDIVLYNGTAIALIEVKYKVLSKYLDKMVTEKVPHFRKLFPYYANHTIYLGIGSMSFDDEVVTHAKELGIGILKQHGEAIEADTTYVKPY